MERRTAFSSQGAPKSRRTKPCAASEAGFAPDDAYKRAVQMVAAVAISNAPFEPPTRLDCNAVQQAVVEKSTKYSLGLARWKQGSVP